LVAPQIPLPVDPLLLDEEEVVATGMVDEVVDVGLACEVDV